MAEHWAVEFHDSEISSVYVEGSRCVMHTRLNLHSSVGRAGFDNGKSWTQDARFLLEDAHIEKQPRAYPLDVGDGSVDVDGRDYDNILPLPFDAAGRITMRLLGDEGDLVLQCQRLSIELLDRPEYVDEFER